MANLADHYFVACSETDALVILSGMGAAPQFATEMPKVRALEVEAVRVDGEMAMVTITTDAGASITTELPAKFALRAVQDHDPRAWERIERSIRAPWN